MVYHFFQKIINYIQGFSILIRTPQKPQGLPQKSRFMGVTGLPGLRKEKILN